MTSKLRHYYGNYGLEEKALDAHDIRVHDNESCTRLQNYTIGKSLEEA